MRYLSIALVLACLSGACDTHVPEPGSEAYRQAVTDFYTGLAALDVGAHDRAAAALSRLTANVPGEPAGWANLALLQFSLGREEEAIRSMERAQGLTPENAELALLMGTFESRRGRTDEAVFHLRRALSLAGAGHLKAGHALARELERKGDAAGALAVVEGLLGEAPTNLALLLERIRLAAKAQDADGLKLYVARVSRRTGGWPEAARAQLQALSDAGTDFRLAARHAAFLNNALLRTPVFRRDLRLVRLPAQAAGEPLRRFVKMRSPSADPAPADASITFVSKTLDSSAGGTMLGIAWADTPVVLMATDDSVRWLDSSRRTVPTSAPGGVGVRGLLSVDWNNDFGMDLVVAGGGGVRLYRQGDGRALLDVTGRTALDAEVIGAAYTGVWPADIEMDGDLDLVLGGQEQCLVLRNNGDGTFAVVRPFEGVSGARAFEWTDLDDDGVPDAALIDSRGRLVVFLNKRSGSFVRSYEGRHEASALVSGDVDGDGSLNLLILNGRGGVSSISHGGGRWEVSELVGTKAFETPARLFLADIDNNGQLDLVASGEAEGACWLGDAEGSWRRKVLPNGVRIFEVLDLTGDGRIDLLGLSEDGRPRIVVSRGNRKYHWQVVRPRVRAVRGDGRINSYALGGEVLARSGLLAQRRPIRTPMVHFGLGEYDLANVVRVQWPNGTIQAEFDVAADQIILAQQRLKGSCPWVFAFNGEEMAFIKDFLWRSPLGMRINAQVTAGVSQTEDWILIRGDELVSRDGLYDIRITSELWETQFVDWVELMVVDHPPDVAVFVDERFAMQQPDLKVIPTGTPVALNAARDESGRDVAAMVSARDARYLDTFEVGRYQGVAADHWVEVDLPQAAKNGGGWLIGYGWIYPTDSSINVAMGHGADVRPRGLRLDALRSDGTWETVKPDLGFPAGKFKTITIDLAGVKSSRLRLRTNLEIYWDWLAWAERADGAQLQTHRVRSRTAALRGRGFSEISHPDRRSPDVPLYSAPANTAPRWWDLRGYHTRFGDVRPLLAVVDDRYVIMNAGDELVLSFPDPGPPPDGWVRDFVLMGDGWVKDGDYNTAFSGTVLPLPSHAWSSYETPPGRLEDDPVYRRNPMDWQEYHTRYVTPAISRMHAGR
ncbi:MAG: FG-GAP-like repeat-containing protein [Gemmatimonadota bacterium]|nr:FG-GAP-like repeat-containing protein [Gemmatimonadota bacterium]